VEQCGVTTEARPPVAIVVAPGSSARIRVTIASTSPAVPNTRPDWIASTVLVPTTFDGAVSSTLVRRAVRENRLAALACRPGAITPPRNSPCPLTTSKFVAVPKSTTIAGPPVRV
jgi:hypothetical protein